VRIHLSETGFRLDVFHIEYGQTISPEGQRTLGNREGGDADLARAGAATTGPRKREVGHDRTGRAHLIAIVEVINLGRVEIDGLFHAAQAKGLGEKIVVGLRSARQRGDVV
jgi:hypothetical protein